MKHLSNPLLWLLLAFTLFFLGLGSVGFVGPDEPRYADVARGMLQSGDYVTPHLFGQPWFEKPPLYYWFAALFFHMGVTEISARLVSALAAALLLWFWFNICNRQFGLRTAAVSCIMLGSTVGWIAFAHAAVTDMLFAATLDASLLLLGVWLWRKQEQYLYGFFVLLALATLAKGPVAVLLAGIIALAYVVTFREWKTLWHTIYSPGLSFFIVLALPWVHLLLPAERQRVRGGVFRQAQPGAIHICRPGAPATQLVLPAGDCRRPVPVGADAAAPRRGLRDAGAHIRSRSPQNVSVLLGRSHVPVLLIFDQQTP